MKKIKYIGVFREAEHSPERILDDELILRAVGKRLSQHEHIDIRLIYPAELDGLQGIPDLIFYMAEEEPVLKKLEEIGKHGSVLINEIQGVRNTFRKEMTETLTPLPFVPNTTLAETHVPPADNHGPVWIKRGDYHAIEENDVVFAANSKDMRDIFKSFHDRGIETVAIQQHIPGDLIKFYGVRKDSGNTRWFHWFYHRDQELNNYPFNESMLRQNCEQAADHLCLEIFGGDAIINEQGEIFIIDMNAWPSFALFRDTAAHHIACHILEKSLGVCKYSTKKN